MYSAKISLSVKVLLRVSHMSYIATYMHCRHSEFKPFTKCNCPYRPRANTIPDLLPKTLHCCPCTTHAKRRTLASYHPPCLTRKNTPQAGKLVNLKIVLGFPYARERLKTERGARGAQSIHTSAPETGHARTCAFMKPTITSAPETGHARSLFVKPLATVAGNPCAPSNSLDCSGLAKAPDTGRFCSASLPPENGKKRTCNGARFCAFCWFCRLIILNQRTPHAGTWGATWCKLMTTYYWLCP